MTSKWCALVDTQGCVFFSVACLGGFSSSDGLIHSSTLGAALISVSIHILAYINIYSHAPPALQIKKVTVQGASMGVKDVENICCSKKSQDEQKAGGGGVALDFPV